MVIAESRVPVQFGLKDQSAGTPQVKLWIGGMDFVVGIPPQNVQGVVIMVDGPQSLLVTQAYAADAVPADPPRQLP